MSIPTPLARQRGLSLVELLIGCAVALFIVSGALKLFVDHLRDSRRLLLEARVHQDMRAASDLIARDLRRAGYWQAAPGGGLNPYRLIAPAGSTATATVTYSFSRDAIENDTVDAAESTGFRLATDTLQTLNGGSWQAVTDPGTVRVVRFSVTPQIMTVPLGQFCLPACAAGSAGCPALHVRSYLIELRGQSATDPGVVREIRESVHVRNDELSIAACPASTT
ncbi:PilW family protein [Methylibium sp.]|uniref:PilW family protein n=1 Tax=Methylibium sp. TaxID=2067992 RepID=UPI003D0FAA3F